MDLFLWRAWWIRGISPPWLQCYGSVRRACTGFTLGRSWGGFGHLLGRQACAHIPITGRMKHWTESPCLTNRSLEGGCTPPSVMRVLALALASRWSVKPLHALFNEHTCTDYWLLNTWATGWSKTERLVTESIILRTCPDVIVAVMQSMHYCYWSSCLPHPFPCGWVIWFIWFIRFSLCHLCCLSQISVTACWKHLQQEPGGVQSDSPRGKQLLTLFLLFIPCWLNSRSLSCTELFFF